MNGEDMSLYPIPISSRRTRRERGNEIIEFALLLSLLAPMLLWVFINGMNLIKIIEASQVCRDIGNLYIHGVDFSTYDAQQVATTLASGFGLQIGSSFSGNSATNDANSGNGLVIVSEIMYAGSSACSALPSGTTCTNENKYVFLQRIYFGNSSLTFNGNTVASALGTPAATINSYGYVENYLTDPNAVSATAGNYITLADTQVAYVSETFFSSPNLGFASYPGGGVYNRTFF
jgi:hypothetical protein